MDKSFLTGNLGRDPELRYTQSGTAVCDFSVGVRRSVKQGEKWEKATVWYKCTAWGKKAEAVNNYLAKGDGVAVEGELQFDVATGSPKIWSGNDGQPRTSFEIRVLDWEITNHRSGLKPNQQPQQPNSQYTQYPQQGQPQQYQGQPQQYQTPPQQGGYQAPPAPPTPQYPQGATEDEIPF